MVKVSSSAPSSILPASPPWISLASREAPRLLVNEISLTSKRGAALEAKLVHGALEGKIELADEELTFTIGQAEPPAGIYRARGSKTTIGWIVLSDGSQEGIQTTGEESAPAPELDPDNPEVTVDGEQLQGEPVSGDQDL